VFSAVCLVIFVAHFRFAITVSSAVSGSPHVSVNSVASDSPFVSASSAVSDNLQVYVRLSGFVISLIVLLHTSVLSVSFPVSIISSGSLSSAGSVSVCYFNHLALQ
jgi:hypothetical protein